MFDRLRQLMTPPRPAGPMRVLAEFDASSPPVTRDGVSSDQGGWRIEASGKRTVRLFEVPLTEIERGVLTYRALLKAGNLNGKAYLEMLCCFPVRGEYFSRGMGGSVSNSQGWSPCETPFFLKQHQRPDLVKLNVVTKGRGAVWVKDVALEFTPLG